MVRGFTSVLILLGIVSGCTSLQTRTPPASSTPTTSSLSGESDSASKNTHQEYETLLWQQAAMLQRQRESILELQRQREEMQQQLTELAKAISTNPPLTAAPVAQPIIDNRKIESPPIRTQVDVTGKLILGHVEWAWFDLFGDSVKARIDTGARSSIVFASDIQVFERDGSGWVSFSVSSTWQDDKTPSTKLFEAPLVRRVKVKASEGDPSIRRPVVRLTIKVGSIVEDIEFVLQQKNQGSDQFPVILGRSFVRDIAIVDAAQELTQKKHTKASSL